MWLQMPFSDRALALHVQGSGFNPQQKNKQTNNTKLAFIEE
jgi:hypothetical protein